MPQNNKTKQNKSVNEKMCSKKSKQQRYQIETLEKEDETESSEITYKEEVYEEVYSGLFPHPSYITGYNQSVKNGGERIFQVIERSLEADIKDREEVRELQKKELNATIDFQKDIIELERTKEDNDTFLAKMGVFSGLIIGLSTLASATYIALSHPIAGVSLGIGGIAALVGVFVYGTNKNNGNGNSKQILDQEDS